MCRSNPNKLTNVLRKTRARHSFLMVKKVASAVQLIEQIANSAMKKHSYKMDAKIINGTAKVIVYGSYMLNAATIDSDLDLLVVIPQFVFVFDYVCEFLHEAKECADLKDVILQRTKINIIMAHYKNIKVDVTFARYPEVKLPPNIHSALTNECVFESMDMQSRGMVESYLTTYEISQVSESNPIFASSLRAIKHWAKSRCIYSNIFGFLNGVSLSIMLARVYRKFKCKSTEELVDQFFRYYAYYDWMISVKMKDDREYVDQRKSCSPITELIQVLTPISNKNCTDRVTISHSYVIQTEFIRAKNICDAITRKGISWTRLFEPAEFFNSYDYFIFIIACCPEEHLGRVKCDARGLAVGLENLDDIKYTHLSNMDYEVSKSSKYDFDYPDNFVKVLWTIAVVPDKINLHLKDIMDICRGKMDSFDRFSRIPFCNLTCMTNANFYNCINIFMGTRGDIKSNVKIDKLKYKIIENEDILESGTKDEPHEVDDELDGLDIEEVTPNQELDQNLPTIASSKQDMDKQTKESK